ncbi:MAG: hypothetical protein LQ351_000604 [Letrouitia transgressa]|nr:MAG: hypothetical protein LQ351_000604 [Letrouitia transgressa]
MGRRKIEIKAIKDDRNRSVTFLKRKGGLFKKAHELSVLCSVDVAVIIFGHNKKLYEYSSGDIQETIGRYQYYGGAHEHKGPADFAGRGGMIDDDDDDMGSPQPEDHMQQEHQGVPQIPTQPAFGHMRQPAPSASPPIQNGVPYHPRNQTPQPQMVSRPGSRNNISRPSNFPAPHHQVTQGSQGPNGYAYVSNPSVYNPHAAHGMPVASHHAQQPGQQPHYYNQHHPPQQHPQLQQAYIQEQRRQSMPPAFPQHERTQQQQPPQTQQPAESPPQPKQEPPSQENDPNRLSKPAPSKSRSIFTPIDDSRSLLAQHWGLGKSTTESRNETKSEKENRSQSVDVSNMHRNSAPEQMTSPPKPQKATTLPQRNQSLPDIPPPPRTSSSQIGGKRPRLKVQIPSEQSDGGSATAESSPRESGDTTGGTPAKASTDASHSSGVVLPPPSPSASAIISAGAQGPPNPFARPHPPIANNPNGTSFSSNNNIETPISALPSRFVADNLLPSPSSFYPEWGFGRSGGENNMLPSPLNFQTPVMGNGPSFLRDEDAERKRKSPEGEGQEEGSNVKRIKT